MAGYDALHTPGGVTDARDARHAQGGMITKQGPTILDVRTGVAWGPGSTALVTGTSATGTMTVSIASHVAVSSRSTADGPYLGPTLEAATTVNIGAAPGANSRIDVVWAKQQDAASTVSPDGATGPLYGVTAGTAAASPTKPAIPVGAVELATVQVAAGATSTNGAGVTISNTARQVVAAGARIPVRTAAERNALTTFPGLEVYRLDTGSVEVRNAANTAWLTLHTQAVTQQAGRATVSLAAANSDSGTVVFPTAFGAAPSAVILTPELTTGSSIDLIAVLTAAPTATQFTWRIRERAGSSVTISGALNWVAIL